MACWVVGMLLLVAGLVVIVLVILVVVFLSVRSMRAEESSARPARPDRANRGDLHRGEAMREPARRGPAEDDWLADHEPDFGGPERDQARDRLPRPRSHQHDEDATPRARPQKRPDARRRQRQESVPQVAGSGLGKPGADSMAGDWGEVSDEQYWAELSADKPLATTARSAQAGGGAHPDAATWSEEADADPADTDDRGARRDPVPDRSQQDPAPTMAAAGASTAQFSLPSRSARAGRLPAGPADPPAPSELVAFGASAADTGPAMSSEPWADPTSNGGVDTDPSIGMGGWQDATGGAPAWQPPDRDEPIARGSRTEAEDPLTSPSFSVPGYHSADSRSYRGSHTRGRGRLDDPAGGFDDSSYGRGPDYQAAPAWEDSYGGSHDGGRRGAGGEYLNGRLDPLPGGAGPAAEPDGGWYSAPTSPAGTAPYRQPPPESWERREGGYDDAPWHDPYTEPGRRTWPNQHEGAGYDPIGYDAGPGLDSASSGYYGDPGYDPAGYDPADSGYGQPDRRHGGASYGQPGYGTAQPHPRPPEHGSPDTGYDPPDYGRGYQPDHDARETDYRLPGHGSGASRGGLGQGSGYGRYPGYDAGRR
jgi:hypothetical protein